MFKIFLLKENITFKRLFLFIIIIIFINIKFINKYKYI